jgi:spermidine/putrescine transport system ATP-binding protein
MENIVRRFGEVHALSRVSLSVRPGEFFSLLGPSGCGKTTLLRIIAGLDQPDEGTLKICGTDAREIPAHKRPVNTVFQSYALFPHLTVRDNVSFGLRMKRVPKPEIEPRVQRAMELVEIIALSERTPSQISGGQKQRVALARALVNEPQVLLLDEPLGALDLKLRRQLQEELHRLQQRLGITFIYVTHDQEEALALSDRIAVMNAGRIEQVGRPPEIYERPRNRFVAQFLGSCNLLEARCTQEFRVSSSEFRVQSAIGELCFKAESPLACSQFTVTIRPEKIQILNDAGPCDENCFPALVRDISYSGAATEYVLAIGDQLLKATVGNTTPGQHSFSIGQEVRVHLPPSTLVLLDD